MMEIIKKNPTITEIGYLKYWCTYGMTPYEMKELKIKDQFIYLNRQLKKYKHKLTKEEYERIKTSLNLLYLNEVMEYAKSTIKNHIVFRKTLTAVNNDPENHSI